MSIIVTGDLHWNEAARDSYRHDFVGTLADHLQRERASALLILGDLTQEKDRHGAWLVTQIFEHVSKLSGICPVIILKGNHDYLQPSLPFFQALGKLPRVTWINEPTVVEDLELPGGSSLFLPHTRDHETDWKGLNVKTCKFVFAHNTFKGAKSESGQELDGIPRSVFAKKQKVIAGDVHVPQTIGSVTYTGAPYPINFGDDYDPRLLLIRRSGKLEDIAYNGPRKVALDLKLGEKKIKTPAHGDIVKVSVYLKADDRHEVYQEYKDWLVERFRKAGCVLATITPVVEKGTGISPEKRRKLRRKSDKKILEAYATSLGINEQTLKTGYRLMRKT